MSIKIYQGFLIWTADFTKILELVRNFRPVAIELQKEVFTSFMELFDEREKGLREWRERRKKIREIGLADSIVDTDFQITLFPTGYDTVCGITICERFKWHEQWLASSSLIKDYGYWDNTDKPDDMTEQEWKHRKEMWHKILFIHNGIPAMDGFTIDIGEVHDPMFIRI